MVVSHTVSTSEVTSKTYSVRRVVANVDGLALEKVGHEDLVLVLIVAGCEDIGTLEGLVLEAKDVVDDKEGLLSILRTSGVGLHAVNGRVSALGFITLTNDGRNGTASLRLHFVFASDGSIMCCVAEERKEKLKLAQSIANEQRHDR
jgi:hypothetical protein